mmetsp:Transcript_56589/g.145825  ORF Transcript_56589/g.145825 Transcript_56589/m.145825 type:complete len:363 (+) Transcript_56589:173-1261(+)
MPKKLKQFLLNYDPPGIGLEFREVGGDKVEVVHKDLPDRSRVQHLKDIMPLVDKLIAEDDNLTARRHRPALIQLLGRLYQVDVRGADGEDGPDSPHSKDNQEDDAGDAEGDDAPWQEGRTVVMIGLQGKHAVHNGETGVISKARRDKGKYEVTVKGEVIKLKGTDSIVLFQDAPLVVNTAVVIRGLRNHTELNGCLGRVVECHTETHRFEVRATESGQLFRVKQENLTPIHGNYIPVSIIKGGQENREPNVNTSPRGTKGAAPAAADASLIGGAGGDAADDDEFFEAGSSVKLQGLKTAMVYNGQTAEVLSVDRARHRYEIRLADGSVKTIRSENVRLVSRPPKSSARKKVEGSSKAADRGK